MWEIFEALDQPKKGMGGWWPATESRELPAPKSEMQPIGTQIPSLINFTPVECNERNLKSFLEEVFKYISIESAFIYRGK